MLFGFTSSASRAIQAVVFDMGDVLYDASQWRRWLTRELNDLGYRLSFSELVMRWEQELLPVYLGQLPYQNAFDRLLVSLISDTQTRAIFRRRSLEAKAGFESEQRRPYEGVVESLTHLCSKGLKLGVLSDTEATAHGVRQSLNRLGLSTFFAAVVTSRDIGSVKPEPDAYMAILRELGALPEQSLFVGHDQDELDGAKAIGMATVALETTGPVCGHQRINSICQLFAFVSEGRESDVE